MRDDQQAPADHVGAVLAPERQLLRDVGVLVDARVDLARPEDQPVPREGIDRDLAVVLAVAPRRHPGSQVVPLRRRKGQEQDELFRLCRRGAS